LQPHWTLRTHAGSFTATSKASNVIVRGQGDSLGQHAVLIDYFRIATAEPDSRSALTRTGAVIDTLAYMAPERFVGEPAGLPADTYSLACLLHELLTGRKPYDVHGMRRMCWRTSTRRRGTRRRGRACLRTWTPPSWWAWRMARPRGI
jgi:serine/threonine protein kinase